MERIKIVLYSLIHALAVLAYVCGVAYFIENANTLFLGFSGILAVAPILMLLVFSVGLMGILVFGRPAYLYMKGAGRDGVDFLLYTLGWILVLLVLIYAFIIKDGPNDAFVMDPTLMVQSQTHSTKDAPREANNQDPNLKTYTSKTWGVEFDYLESVGTESPDDKIQVKETGNKIFVYYSRISPENGQYLELWHKPAGQTLDQAIKTKFLANSPDKCFVSEVTPLKGTNLLSAHIEVKGADQAQDQGELSALAEGCSDYMKIGGINYFIMDPKHPDRFGYLSIGQYAIPAATGTPDNPITKTWQDTIRFK